MEASLPLWHRAVSLAERGHVHQLRKDGRTPYAAHVVRVMMIVRDCFGCDDETVLAAAVLHDYIEDTPGDYDDIEELVGAGVAEIVAVLTKDAAKREDVRDRLYFEGLEASDWRAKLVKLADTVDNLSDLGTLDPSDTGRRERAGKKARIVLEMASRDPEAGGKLAKGIGMVEAMLG